MNFFADANISTRAVKLLEIFDAANSIVHHDARFQRGTADIAWMSELARDNPKPVVLCGDGRILTNEAEKRALREADLSFVVFKSAWMRLEWEQLAWKLLKTWPSIVKSVSTVKRPSIFEVTINEKVELIRATADHR